MATRIITCAECGTEKEVTSTRAMFCSPACRKRANRRPSGLGARVLHPVPDPPAYDVPLVPHAETWSRADVLEQLDAMVENLADEQDQAQAIAAATGSAIFAEMQADMELHQRTAASVRAWVARALLVDDGAKR